MTALPPNPNGLLYPSSWFPTNDPPYDTSIPDGLLYPSFSFLPSSRKRHVTIVYGRNDRAVVGHPFPGQHPRPLLEPGALEDVPVTYQRIHYPGDSVFPDRGLYPYNEATHIPTSFVGQVAVHRNGLRLAVPSSGAATAGVARFIVDLNFNTFGVQASDADRKMRTVVELATITESVEMSTISASLEFETIGLPVELAS